MTSMKLLEAVAPAEFTVPIGTYVPWVPRRWQYTQVIRKGLYPMLNISLEPRSAGH